MSSLHYFNWIRWNRLFDIIMNVLLPLLMGACCYFPPIRRHLPEVLLNYLPDAIWAYAFQSLILIIWNRKIMVVWTIVIILSGLCFEFLQYIHYYSGTGDWLDGLVYVSFVLMALRFNQKFVTLNK